MCTTSNTFRLLLVLLCLSLTNGVSAHFVDTLSLVKEEVEQRWQAFQAYREFEPFRAGKSDSLLEQEFKQITMTRQLIWSTEGYEFSQELIDNDLIRAPGCIAFAYNNTSPSYNASTIYLDGKYYIASEGPRSKDIPHFFDLLVTYKVTHLMRLTSSYEVWIKKCHPYWDGFMQHTSNGAYLVIPSKRGEHYVQAHCMDYWKDHHGINPKDLLTNVLHMREEIQKHDGLLLVHCSAGVGRTGTFLAALAIVDAIDRGKPFSIEEIVYRLSLQRIHSVAKCEQYITLHQFAEYYSDLSTL